LILIVQTEPVPIPTVFIFIFFFILDELISRLVPELGQIRSALELVACDRKSCDVSAPKRRSRPLTAEEREEDLLPQLKPTPGTELRFTQFPERNFPEGSTPAEITHHSLDSTYVLETMLAKYKRCVAQGEIIVVTKLFLEFMVFLGHIENVTALDLSQM
jgi:A1 cistron-splicing factor AAR2